MISPGYSFAASFRWMPTHNTADVGRLTFSPPEGDWSQDPYFEYSGSLEFLAPSGLTRSVLIYADPVSDAGGSVSFSAPSGVTLDVLLLVDPVEDAGGSISFSTPTGSLTIP